YRTAPVRSRLANGILPLISPHLILDILPEPVFHSRSTNDMHQGMRFFYCSAGSSLLQKLNNLAVGFLARPHNKQDPLRQLMPGGQLVEARCPQHKQFAGVADDDRDRAGRRSPTIWGLRAITRELQLGQRVIKDNADWNFCSLA